MLALARRLAPLACVAASGCYVATTTLPSTVARGQAVQLELNDAGSRELTGVLGPRALTLSGRVAARSDSSLDVDVAEITRSGGGEETWHGASVTVPTRLIGRAQTRRFAAVQTGVLVAAGVVALVIGARAVRGNDDLGRGARGGGTGSGQ